MVHNKNKSLIVGSGSEAELMYNNVVKKNGQRKCLLVKNTPANEKLLQKEARNFGADVILGVRTNNANLPDHNINSFPDPKIKQPDEIYKKGCIAVLSRLHLKVDQEVGLLMLEGHAQSRTC